MKLPKAAPKFTDKIAREYATMWDTMEITRDTAVMKKTVARIVEFRAAYEAVERITNVPWYFVGILDMREGGGGACKHLHNGDSLKRPTVQVPANRPPGSGPFTFLSSACDALKLKKLDQITDWSIERIAYECERYNGFGYRLYRGIVSPYLWGGTNLQQKGKYVADGVYSTAVMDPQHGCMPLLKLIAETCEIAIPSKYGATADHSEPSSASNSKTEQPVSAQPAITAGTIGGGGLGLNLLAGDPVGMTSAAVALKGNTSQLLAGVDLTTWGVPALILLAAGGLIFYLRRTA